MASIRDTVIKMHPLMADLLTTIECTNYEYLLPQAPLPDTKDGHYRKSNSRAIESMKLGKKCSRKKKYGLALKYFNESVASAQEGSPVLAEAYGHRAAILTVRKMYHLGLLDSNRALLRLPSSEGTKIKVLLKIKWMCWERLEKAKKRTRQMRKEGAAMLTPYGRYIYYMHRGVSNIDETDFKENDLHLDRRLWKAKYDNDLLPNVSSAVKIAQNAEFGRHLVATKDIQPGQVLSIQDYFAMVTLIENNPYQFCDYCTAWCGALIPCPTCTKAMYCSDKCRAQAYDTYHQTECKILPLVLESYTKDSELINSLLPLRIFLTGTKQGADLTNLMNNSSEVFKRLKGEFDCVGVTYAMNDYLAILNLPLRNVRKDDAGSQTENDYREDEPYNDLHTIQYARHLFPPNMGTSAQEVKRQFLAIFSALKRYNVIEEHGAQNAYILTDKEIFAALLILQNLLVVKRRHGCCTTATFSNPDFRHLVGWAVGNTTSLMNHSCTANAVSITHKRRGLVYSIRPIKAGEQIFINQWECFGDWYPLKLRKKFLNEFYIECRCRACIKNWPTKGDLFKTGIRVWTSECFPIVSQEKVGEIMTTYLQQKEMLRGSEVKEEHVFLEEMFEYNRTIRQYVKQPSPTIFLCEQFIMAKMLEKGNFYVFQPYNFSDGL